MKFLTFDLGTTLFKVCLFDDGGNLLGVERIAPPVERPRPGWLEMDQAAFLGVLQEAAQNLRRAVGTEWAYISAASVTTQANTFCLVDRTGRAKTKFILWPDDRAAPLADELSRIANLPGFRRSTGMPRFGAALALAKTAWLARHEPDVMEEVEAICFLSQFLTGQCAAGVAGLSGAFDIRSLRWRPDVLERLGLPRLRMPIVVRAGSVAGDNWGNFAEFGLPRGCPWIVGCLDQYAGAIGTGTVEPGRVCETTGTVLAAVRCADRLAEDPPPTVFQGPGFSPDRWFQMSFSSTSANLLDWYHQSVPGEPPSFDELTRLAREAERLPPVIIEPYDNTADVAACFRHVRPEHTVGQVVRGIMKRVAASLAEQVRSLCSNAMPTEIRSAGGAARNDYWLQLKADALGVPFVALENEEPTSLGAAILAARAMGLGSVEELAARWVRPRARFTPRTAG